MEIYDIANFRKQKNTVYCYHYTLDVKIKIYNPRVCSECYRTFYFFPSDVKILLNNAKNNVVESDTIVKN